MRGHRGTVAREARIRKSRFDPHDSQRGPILETTNGEARNRSKRYFAFFAQLFSSSIATPLTDLGRDAAFIAVPADPDRRAGLP